LVEQEQQVFLGLGVAGQHDFTSVGGRKVNIVGGVAGKDFVGDGEAFGGEGITPLLD